METFGQVRDETTDKPHVPLKPYRKPLRTWAGHGTGAQCNGCGETIQAQDIEYEIELPTHGEERPLRFQPDGNVSSLHFHFGCYKNWIRS